jgi:hypothetical protein
MATVNYGYEQGKRFDVTTNYLALARPGLGIFTETIPIYFRKEKTWKILSTSGTEPVTVCISGDRIYFGGIPLKNGIRSSSVKKILNGFYQADLAGTDENMKFIELPKSCQPDENSDVKGEWMIRRLIARDHNRLWIFLQNSRSEMWKAVVHDINTGEFSRTLDSPVPFYVVNGEEILTIGKSPDSTKGPRRLAEIISESDKKKPLDIGAAGWLTRTMVWYGSDGILYFLQDIPNSYPTELQIVYGSSGTKKKKAPVKMKDIADNKCFFGNGVDDGGLFRRRESGSEFPSDRNFIEVTEE